MRRGPNPVLQSGVVEQGHSMYSTAIFPWHEMVRRHGQRHMVDSNSCLPGPFIQLVTFCSVEVFIWSLIYLTPLEAKFVFAHLSWLSLRRWSNQVDCTVCTNQSCPSTMSHKHVIVRCRTLWQLQMHMFELQYMDNSSHTPKLTWSHSGKITRSWGNWPLVYSAGKLHQGLN